MADLTQVVQDVSRLGSVPLASGREGVHVAATLVHRMLLAIRDCQAQGWSAEQVRSCVEPARRVYAQSPFVRRLQEWPRGYAGDFETVEYILEARNRSSPGSLAYWLEQYALDSPLAQQHRNKVWRQASLILDTILLEREHVAEPSVLIVAAGSSPDLRMVQSLLASRRFRVVLLDQDPDALQFSLDRLPLIRDRICVIERDVVRGLRHVKAHGPFDLVLAGGLFDYLPDRVAEMVLRQSRDHLLGTDGVLFFTNIACGNPYKEWIEFLGDWHLLHRSEADLRRLCASAGFDPGTTTVETDQTGLAYLVRCAAEHARRAPSELATRSAAGLGAERFSALEL